MAAVAQSALWDSSRTDPCVPEGDSSRTDPCVPEEIQPQPQPQRQGQPAATGPNPLDLSVTEPGESPPGETQAQPQSQVRPAAAGPAPQSNPASGASSAVCPLLPVPCAAAELGCACDKAAHTAACSLHAVLSTLRVMSTRIRQLETELAALKRQTDEHVQPLQWHKVDDAWCKQHGVVLGRGWKQENDTIYPFCIAKDAHGRVQLKGVITGGQADDRNAILTLPEGYRPATSVHQSGNGARGVGDFTIDLQGRLVIRTKAGPQAWFSFDGCSFSTV